MELQIEINKDEIINQAAEVCSLVAVRKDDFSLGAPSTNTKSIVMGQYFSEGVSTLLDSGKRYDPIVYDDAVAFLMPDRFDERRTDALTVAACSYLVNEIIGKWLAIISPSDADNYNKLAASHLAQFGEMLNMRTTPARKQLKRRGY